MSIERAVALLTPLFAAASAALTGWLSVHFPGLPHLDPTEVTALMVAGASAAAGAALKWLHGRQKFVQDSAAVEAFVRSEVAKAAASPAGPELAGFEALLKSHTDQIVQAIGAAVHAPPSVTEVVGQILEQAKAGEQTFQSAGAPAPTTTTPGAPA